MSCSWDGGASTLGSVLASSLMAARRCVTDSTRTGSGQIGVEVSGGLNSCSQLQAYDNQRPQSSRHRKWHRIFILRWELWDHWGRRNGCDIAASNGGTFNSFGDLIGAGLTGIVGDNGACPGFFGDQVSSGTVNLYGSNIQPGVTTGSSAIFIAGSGSIARA